MAGNEALSEDHGVVRRNLLTRAGAGLAGGLIGTTASLQAQAKGVREVLGEEAVWRTSKNLADLLVRLSADYEQSIDRLMPLRLRIFNDITKMFNALNPEDRGCLLSILTLGVREILVPAVGQSSAALSASSDIQVKPGSHDFSPPAPAPEPGPAPECKAQGVEAKRGNITVGAGLCPGEDIGTVSGGGFWAEFRY
jgi:hypothetical protein